jgi:hypothetical protein
MYSITVITKDNDIINSSVLMNMEQAVVVEHKLARSPQVHAIHITSVDLERDVDELMDELDEYVISNSL